MTDSTNGSAKTNPGATDKTNVVQPQQPQFRSTVTRDRYPTRYDASFSPNDEVWMKNPATGRFEYSMIVVYAKYDEYGATWKYKVKSSNGREYGPLVPEASLQE